MFIHVACEIVLLSACLAASLVCWKRRDALAAIGFALIGIASALGALEYAGLAGLGEPHRFASRLSGKISLFLVALDALRVPGSWLLAALALAAFPFLPPFVSLAVNIVALAGIVWGGRRHALWSSLAGAVLFALAGLLIGTKGEWHGFARLDLYHLAIAAAVACWAAGSLRRGRT
ncbi:hypothetical protein [Noviherbaspirillum galbum]|uniref:Uncharacterized protein n=1 Tax=Noviherbaspirillum galbum TaxID=2709383 RepID=A0A6B3STD8_9BURK|nr:hypothetical protein [Noviherbaspirillum galbum]NEX63901.1 hypothetical protein [Noviherbaspirillum galbum]